MPDVAEILESLSAGSGVRRRLGTGEMLFAAGDPVHSLVVVESGRLRLLRHTVHGAALTLHVARAGEALAEASLFARAYHCDAVADVPSTVSAHPRRALLAALRGDPAAALALPVRGMSAARPFAAASAAATWKGRLRPWRLATDRCT